MAQNQCQETKYEANHLCIWKSIGGLELRKMRARQDLDRDTEDDAKAEGQR